MSVLVHQALWLGIFLKVLYQLGFMGDFKLFESTAFISSHGVSDSPSFLAMDIVDMFYMDHCQSHAFIKVCTSCSMPC